MGRGGGGGLSINLKGADNANRAIQSNVAMLSGGQSSDVFLIVSLVLEQFCFRFKTFLSHAGKVL